MNHEIIDTVVLEANSANDLNAEISNLERKYDAERISDQWNPYRPMAPATIAYMPDDTIVFTITMVRYAAKVYQA